jgi:hypothetical protein
MSSAFSSSRWLSRRFLILAAATLSTGLLTAQEEKITYDDHIRPLLENKCFSCHNPDKKKGGLELTSYAGLINGGSGGAVVDAGNPIGSRLWTCSSKKEEPYMPPEGAPLEPKDLALLSKWIAGGVLQAKGSVAQKSNRPKVDLSFAGGAGKPTGEVARPRDVLLEPVLVTAHTSAITAMAASPWTSLLAVAGQHQILLYDTETKELAGILPYAEGYARSLKFSANGSLLILGGGRGGKFGHAVVWDVATGRRVAEVGKEFDQVMSADITPDHRKVALATNGKKVKGYDVASGELLFTISKHTEWVTGVSFSPDGVLLASSDRNGNVMVWESENGGEMYNLGQHTASVTGLAWRADSNILASCSVDGTISTWEMKTGKRVANWSSHGNVQSVAFTPDGNVLTGGADGNTALWDIKGQRIKQSDAVHQDDVVSKVVALYDSKVYVTGNWLGEVRMFDVATGRDLTRISSNPPKIVDRLSLAEKRLAELEAERPKSQAAQAAAEKAIPAAEAELARLRTAGEPAAKALASFKVKLEQISTSREYWNGQLKKAKTDEAKAKANVAIASSVKSVESLTAEASKVRPDAQAFLGAEAALTKARNDLAVAQAANRNSTAETAAHRERIVALKAAQFNVSVLSERDRLVKLEADIADLIAAKAENEAAKVADARRIESSRKTVAQNAELIPKQEAELKGLQAEFAALDKTLSPFRQSEAEALGKVETQAKLIESRNEAIVRLGLDRDAAVNIVKAAADEFRIKFTTPLRLRLTEATAKADEAKKTAAELKLAATKAKAESDSAHARTEAAGQAAAKTEGVAKQAAADLAAAKAAFAEARSVKAMFSIHYFSLKKESAQRLAQAEATMAPAQSAHVAALGVLAAAKAAEQVENDHVVLALAAAEKAQKEIAPLVAAITDITKERAARVVEREKLSSASAAAEKEYETKLPALQAALKQAQDGLPALEKSLVAIRANLAEAAKPLEVKRLAMDAAAKTVDLTRRESASAEKALLAAQKDIPQRDKNLEEIAKTYAELTPQVEPMKAKVKAVQDQYLAMLPKREVTKKN